MKPLSREKRMAIAIAVVALVLFAWMSAASAEEMTRFHIESGPAAVMLNQFGRQSELQILYDYNTASQLILHAVDGEMSVQDALRALLADTGMEFEFVNERTLAVVAPGESDRPPEGSEWVDENGYADCAPLRYTYSLDGYLQSSSRGEEICLKVAQR